MIEVHVSKIRRIARRPLADGELSIGRSSSNDIVLPSSGVSRRHCVIETTDGVSRLRDCDSHHGTFVNGDRIDGPRILVAGDVIDVGRFQVTFTGEVDAAGADTDDSMAPVEDETPVTRTAGLDERDREMERRAEALDERERKLTLNRAELDGRAETLTEHATALDEREEAIGARLASVEKLQRALTAHEQGLAERDAAQDERASAIDTQETEVQGRAQRLKERETELNEREAGIDERASLTARGDDLEQQLAEAAAESKRLEEQLSAVRSELETATQRADEGAERIRQLETARSEAEHQEETVDRSFQDTHAAAVRLFRVARRADDARRMLPTLEELWFEADRAVEEAEDDSPKALEAASIQRESVARRLENTHAELDAALESLQAELDRFEASVEMEPLAAAELRARRFQILPALRRRLHRSI